MTSGLGAKVFAFVGPYRARFGFILVQLFAQSGLELLKPWPLQIIVDHVLSGKPGTAPAWLPVWSPLVLVALAALAMVLVNLVAGIVAVFYNWTAIGLGQRMVNDMRGRLYGHLQRLSLAYHSRQRVGDLMVRVTSDSFAVQTMIMNGMLPIIAAVILLAGMLVVLLPIDPLLTGVALVIVPIMFVLIEIFNRRIAAIATDVRDSDTLVYSLVQWGISAIKHVQAFTRERDEFDRFMRASGHALGAHRRLYAWQTGYSAVIGVVVSAGTALVVLVGARSVLAGTLSIGQLLVFIAYLGQLYAPVNQITQSWALIAGARVGAERCFNVLDTEPDLADGTFEPSGPVAGRVAFEGASFRYLPETPVVERIDLAVEPGQTVALVGATGAGKSTLVGLIPRFFDATEGVVRLDGVDVRDWRIDTLRHQVSMVLQPPLIFPLSVRENIAYGRPGASLAEIEEAARRARIDGRIATLPQGYETPVGEAGVTLSEGEKQRLTIARALLRDAPILILDEPTSALDAETEAEVIAAIDRLRRGRTTFVIAHRLSTVRRADLILVLKDGRIVERGRFDELVALDGAFGRLHRAQFELQEDHPLAV